MSIERKIILGIIAITVFLISSGSVFIVDQREQALVLEFGKIKRVVKEAGLHLKIPIIEDVKKFSSLVLDLNAEPNEVTLSGQKRLIVDAFIKYRISDPLKYYQTEQVPGSIASLLNTYLDSSVRQELANITLKSLLTDEREKIMQSIQTEISAKAEKLGIEVVDVRIMRADFPKESSDSVYNEMRTDREREAKELRAKGNEEAKLIKATAEKDKVIILAEAERNAQNIRGSGEAEATKIFADSFGKDVNFFNFYRTMQAYRKTFTQKDSTIILSPDNEFLGYLKNQNGQ